MTYWFYYFSRFILRVTFRFGFGLEIRGREHVPRCGGVILAANHMSYLDPPVLGAACPRRVNFLARADLFRHVLLGAFMRGVHVIPLQREEADRSAIREAVKRLHCGDVVGIFPEGGRQFSGRLGTAKRGVGLLAVLAKAPIVPVLIHGTFQALPPTGGGPHRSKIRVAFGQPIPYTVPSLPSRAHEEHLAAAVTQQWHELAAQFHDDR